METIQVTFYVFLVLVQFLILNQVAINTQLLTGTIMPWEPIEDQILENLITELSISDIAKLYKRSESDINERIINLGLINKLISRSTHQDQYSKKTEILIESLNEKYNLNNHQEDQWNVITDVVADFVIDLTDKIKTKK